MPRTEKQRNQDEVAHLRKLLARTINEAPAYDAGIGTEVGRLLETNVAVQCLLAYMLEKAAWHATEVANTELGSENGRYIAAQHQGGARFLEAFVSDIVQKSYLDPDQNEMEQTLREEFEAETPQPRNRRRPATRSRAKTAPIAPGSKRRRAVAKKAKK